MKKTLLAFSLMALGSLQLNAAAACTTSSLTTLAAPGFNCDIVNGSNTWNLSSFGFSNAGPTFSNYVGQPVQTTSAFNVSFALDPFNGASSYAGGFSVTVTPVAANYFGFSATATGSGAQQFNVETTFRIAGNAGAAQLSSFGGSINNPLASAPVVGQPNPAVTLQKFIQQLSNTSIQYILQPDTSSLPGSASLNSPPFNSALLSPNNPGDLVIVDRLRLDGGNTPGNSASLTSYTNYFAPTNPIPEPMTFALMGAGLIGLAVLRRRK